MGERDSHPGGLGNALNPEIMSHETQTHSLGEEARAKGCS